MSGVTAVVLLNLGGPDSRESVQPFLYNFFMDPNIIGAPWPVRKILATLIAKRRSRKEAASSYSLLGWKSPLLENTNAQAAALEQALNSGDGGCYKCFVSMRYWRPRAEEVAARVAACNPDRVILLPLYPQYSTATTRSSFQDWGKAARKAGLNQPTAALCCYPLNDGFIGGSAEKIAAAYRMALETTGDGPSPRLLFSAHGLPEKTIRAGDPYQWQCEQAAAAIAARLDIPELDWRICYQSRVGPLKWIGPSTVEALEQAARDRVPVLVYPHAFVSEHVETLVEIGMEYRHLAKTLGIPYFEVVETVGVNPFFIGGLADMIRSLGTNGVQSGSGAVLCPVERVQCCLRSNEFGTWSFCG